MIGTAKDGGLISRAVREALGTLVSPQMCEQLIMRSLRAQGLAAIPESGTLIGEWLESSLRPEVETAVGADAAELVMMQLGPIAAYAAISTPKQPAKVSVQAPAPAKAAPARQAPAPALFSGFDSDEPDRPTDLRFDPGQTDWSALPETGSKVTKSLPDLPDLTFDSAPPTGIPAAFGSSPPTAQLQALPAYDSSPPTGRAPALPLYQSEPDMAVMTLPPARQISDGARPANDVALYTARPQAPDLDKVLSNAPVSAPAVMVATSDMGDFEALRRYLGATASVTHIPDLVGLLDSLDEDGLVEPIVLIDCQRPTVHTTSVAALGEDLPRGTTIVLWGADENTWMQIDRDRSPTCRWVRCSREASTSDVGSLCTMLIG